MANSDEHKIHKQKKLNFLYVSIVAHILLGLLAAYIIIQVITPRSKPKFTAAPPSQMAVHPDEHKVKQEKRNNTMSAPAIKRITANMPANITLPPMPDVPTLNTTMDAGNRIGAGLGIGVGTGAGPDGGGPHVFGLRGGVGLKGTFYDFKLTKLNKFIKMNDAEFSNIIIKFVHSNFDTLLFKKYFIAPNPLYTPFIFYPNIKSERAPEEFKVKSKPGFWCVVYKGNVIPSESGTYRFVGFGNNIMAVLFNNAVVLENDSYGWKGSAFARHNPDPRWNPKLYKHYNYQGVNYDGKLWLTSSLFTDSQMEGTPINVQAGMTYPLQVIIGDRGGMTTAQLYLKKEGVVYPQDSKKNPVFPVFQVGTAPLPNFSPKAIPPYQKEPPAWSIWKLDQHSMFFKPL